MDAFEAVTPYVQDYAGIFGLIAETVMGSQQPRLRPNQLGPTTSISDILATDPFYSLQMGHFVRTKAAAAVRFDVDMNTGEDFKYYLGLWKQFRCAKIDRVLFINRRGAHSSGPRSANAGEWRETVTTLLKEFPANENSARD